MKGKIANRFLVNYLLMFFISILLTVMAIALTSFANDMIAKNLMKNHYPAAELVRDDYRDIPYEGVLENGGGVQVVNSQLEMVLTKGVDTIGREKLTTEEWTDFLTASKGIDVPYSYDIEYNRAGDYWIVVTFPTSIRIDFGIAHNEIYPSRDMGAVSGFIAAVILFYLLSLAVVTVIYSRITSMGFVNPLKLLYQSAKRLGEGDYSARVKIRSGGEIAELGQIFNSMAEKIEEEITLRRASEENRKRLVLDISHDLKNPLASMMGYAEQCLKNPGLSEEKRQEYAKVIYDSCVRVNGLINDLFEFSKLESSEYKPEPVRLDLCEYLREEMAALLPLLDSAGFAYEFDIPETEIMVAFDPKELRRVLQNLVVNAVQYNPPGTAVALAVTEGGDEAGNGDESGCEDRDGNEDDGTGEVLIRLKDNGTGMEPEIAEHIFEAFVRGDSARNSRCGGTGLGLSIAERIMKAHGGSIELRTGVNQGCEFILRLPLDKNLTAPSSAPFSQ